MSSLTDSRTKLWPGARRQRPLCIDLFAGLGGWTEGFLAEGYECIGYDIERHVYGEHRYPAQLVLQDVRTLDGRQFRDAACIVASSPCQEFSYRAMPRKRAKALGPPLLGMELFAQARRIQREAEAAAGRHIPTIQENVCGAQRWVGRAAWHYGSYYLWGDVPALMPIPHRAVTGSWFSVDRRGRRTERHSARDEDDGVKVGGDAFFSNREFHAWRGAPHSARRKAASARIARIPFALARHIARVYRDRAEDGAA